MMPGRGPEQEYVHCYWDAVVGGPPPETDGDAPVLAAEVRRLHALDGAFAPDPVFLRRLGEELMSQPRIAPEPMVSAVARPWPSPNGRASADRPRWTRLPMPSARRWWPMGEIATVAMFVVTLVTGFAAYRLATPANVGAPASRAAAVELFVSAGGDFEAESLVPLDPESLADRPGEAIELKTSGWGMTISADGSTMVGQLPRDPRSGPPTEQKLREEATEDVVIVVWDGRSGAERTRFTLPIASGSITVRGLRLSQDGSRLVIWVDPRSEVFYGRPEPDDSLGWQVVETATGRLLSNLAVEPNEQWHDQSWIDPAARRLYRLYLPDFVPSYRSDDEFKPTEPGAARLVAHDLDTGAEVGRLELPGVRGGTWDTGRTVPMDEGVSMSGFGNQLPIVGELRPGVALSPDGRRLAIVHADEEAVTLVDAERLLIDRTIPLARPTGIGNRLLGLLPLVPRSAAAKLPTEGTARQALFAADGRHLYVTGNQGETLDDGTWSSRTLPLRVVDLDDGEIVAEEAHDDLFGIRPAADGRSLYAMISLPYDGPGEQVPVLLRRLDPMTLEVQAERRFPGHPFILLRPAVPNGSDYHLV